MFGLEMSSEKELFISGCKGILTCTEDVVVLDIGGRSVTVSGEKITMISYTNGEIYIDGLIDSIAFESGSEQ